LSRLPTTLPDSRGERGTPFFTERGDNGHKLQRVSRNLEIGQKNPPTCLFLTIKVSMYSEECLVQKADLLSNSMLKTSLF
jgi:hypothetical protein